MFRLRYNGVQPSVMADGRMVSSQFWSVGSSKLSRLPCGTRVSFRSQFGYGWGVFPICLRSVYFPSWDHWVFRAYWFLAVSCSGGCVFRRSQGYDTAVIVAREKGAIGAGESPARCGMVWRHFGHQTWAGKSLDPKWRFSSLEIAGITYKWGIFQVRLLDEFSWTRRFNC